MFKWFSPCFWSLFEDQYVNNQTEQKYLYVAYIFCYDGTNKSTQSEQLDSFWLNITYILYWSLYNKASKKGASSLFYVF